MSAAALSERLAEAAGPIVVKEVRQGLRARVFAIFFGLLLIGCLVVALIAAAEFDRRLNAELGPDYFRIFLGGLGIVEFFVIPYSAFRAMTREREDETWVLLVLTGLGPRRIVRGKVASALAQGLLYASACAPFVLFSYYLNGIDLPTVLVALMLSAAWSCLWVCVGVAAATQAESRIGRALVHFLVLGCLLAATVGGIAFAAFFSEEGGRLLREQASFRAFCAGLILWALSTAWVASEGAASGLALLSENSAKGPRVALTVQVLFALVAGAFVAWLADGGDAIGAVVGEVCGCIYLSVAGVFAISEHDGFPPAFAREPGWSKPGALRSFILLVGLLALGTAGCLLLAHLMGSHELKYQRVLLAAPMFVVLYLSLGVLLGRLTPLKVLTEPVSTRFGVLVALVLGTLVPMLLSLMVHGRANDRDLNLLSPLLGLSAINNGDRGALTLRLVGACALFFGFLAWTVLAARDTERRT
ncbi:MAG: ABC transporter permease [Archangiaceae bacterium]|nr:ABC transporter permease [Archangiaceae bacterium]